jgi:Domain of unknown function (DUF4178)
MVTEAQLEQLQVGDRLEYRGVQWRVHNRSHYTDSIGYTAEEWLIRSSTRKEYYLLREEEEEDEDHPEKQVTWYLAEELDDPRITEPGSSLDLTTRLAAEMRASQTPYPELRTLNRSYYFDSQTEGIYESEGDRTTRITWDYWDEPHIWNLALEAWSNGTLVVYSTRQVKLEDFKAVHPEGNLDMRSPVWQGQLRHQENRSIQILIAWAVTIIGFLLMVSGL